MHHALSGALIAFGAPLASGEGPGSGLLFVLLGLCAALLAMGIGHAYWLWRRTRGPLRSADDAVANLAASENTGESSSAPPARDRHP